MTSAIAVHKLPLTPLMVPASAFFGALLLVCAANSVSAATLARLIYPATAEGGVADCNGTPQVTYSAAAPNGTKCPINSTGCATSGAVPMAAYCLNVTVPADAAAVPISVLGNSSTLVLSLTYSGPKCTGKVTELVALTANQCALGNASTTEGTPLETTGTVYGMLSCAGGKPYMSTVSTAGVG